MKNGEEVVSVGGAVDQSNKNVGTSASNSIILDLVEVIFHHFCHSILEEFSNQKKSAGRSCLASAFARKLSGDCK